MEISSVTNSLLLFVTVSGANIPINYDVDNHDYLNQLISYESRETYNNSDFSKTDSHLYQLVDIDTRLESAILQFSKVITDNSIELDSYYSDFVDRNLEDLL